MARTKAIKPIRGRVIAITGGARGIGRATAAAMIARGARVAIGDLDAELAARTAAELGGETLALALDVTSGASFQAFLDEVEMALGPLDVLVNNAGIMPVGRFLDEDEAVTRAEIEINVHGVIRGSKLALMRMLPRGRGHLVNICLAGRQGWVPRDRDVLWEQARRGRLQRVDPPGAAWHLDRGFVRDAGARQYRADDRSRQDPARAHARARRGR